MENTITLTPEGRQKLVDELAYREGEKHDEIVERIKVARDFGDLSENSEFDDAKEEEAKNASRINEIRTILATAKVIDAANGLEVSIGCTVELTDAKGKKTTFTIVGTTETNSLEHKISNESPAGAAVIGHEVGDRVSFSSPSGKVREYTITNVTR
ncbi:MAG: transcription elongation factor GreA [Atopobiaceae bacterium]